MNNTFTYIYYSKLAPIERIFYNKSTRRFTHRLFWEYPDYGEWFDALFDEKLALKSGREIIICEIEERIAGIIILKNNKDEKKICTLKVKKKYQKTGIGKTLIELGFRWLETDSPLMTVNSSKIEQFRSLIDFYGFELTQEKNHYYSIFSTELVFNGELPEKRNFFNRIEEIDMISLIHEFLASGDTDFSHYMDVFFMRCYKREQKRQVLLNAELQEAII